MREDEVPFRRTTPLWETKNGRVMEIHEMDTWHIRHTLARMDRVPQWRAMYRPHLLRELITRFGYRLTTTKK